MFSLNNIGIKMSNTSNIMLGVTFTYVVTFTCVFYFLIFSYGFKLLSRVLSFSLKEFPLAFLVGQDYKSDELLQL